MVTCKKRSSNKGARTGPSVRALNIDSRHYARCRSQGEPGRLPVAKSARSQVLGDRWSPTLLWRSRLAPALTSISAVAVWPPKAAEMRAVEPPCGHVQAEEQQQGDTHGDRQPAP